MTADDPVEETSAELYEYGEDEDDRLRLEVDEMDHSGDRLEATNSEEDSSQVDVQVDASESYHDGESLQESDDMEMIAELIAAEFMETIVENYKIEDGLILNVQNDKINEDLFKDKFPWTLDKEPEPPTKIKEKVKPVVSTFVDTGAHAPKKEKTEREIQDEEYKVKHAQKVIQKDKVLEQEIDFIEFMVSRVELKQLIEVLEKPIEHNPMKMLARIQA